MHASLVMFLGELNFSLIQHTNDMHMGTNGDLTTLVHISFTLQGLPDLIYTVMV
jgi:hypothetical protein